MIKRNRLAENILSLYVVQGVGYVLPLLVFPYLVRVLGLHLFGVVVFVQAIMNYFIILTDYGFNLSATRRISLCRHNLSELRKTFSSVLFVKLCLAFFSGVVLIVASFFVEIIDNERYLFIATFVGVIGHVFFPTWYLQGTEQMRLMSRLSLFGSLVVTVMIFLWVKTPEDYVLVALLQSLALIVPGIMCFLILPKQGISYLTPPSISGMRQVLLEGWHIFVSSAAVTMYTSSNIVILGALSDPFIVGYFGVADKVVKAVHGLISPISQAVYPHVSTLLEKSTDEGFVFLRNFFYWVSLLSLGLSVLLFLFAGGIVYLVTGEYRHEIVLLVKMLSLAPFIVALSNLFGVQIMLNLGMNREFSRILLVSGILNLIVLFPAVLLFSASGAALSIMTTEIFVTCAMMMLLQKKGILKKILAISC